jgi:hypothetical protein
MRRSLSVLISAALASLALSSTASATHSAGQGPKHDFVVGSVKFEGLSPTRAPVVSERHTNAKSGPSGEDPQGHFWIRQETPGPPLDFRGRVTCLTVTGNRAVVGGEVDREQSKLPPPPGRNGVLIEYVDNGEGNEPPDMSRPTSTASPPEVCPSALNIAQPITSGNVSVHDAAP